MKKIIISLSIFAFIFSACVPLDTAPYNSETDLTFWSEDPNAALSALNSCYTSLPDMYEVVYGDGMTDNAYVKGGQNQAIGNGKYGTSEGYVYDVWNHHFSGIRQCNELLVNIDKVPGLGDDLKARYIAEATTLRAYHYYELYIHFGGVPFFDKPISIAEARTAKRESAEQTAGRIAADLNNAIEANALPDSYSGADRGRVTKWTAKAILAKLYLFDANWAMVRDITADTMSGKPSCRTAGVSPGAGIAARRLPHEAQKHAPSSNGAPQASHCLELISSSFSYGSTATLATFHKLINHIF